MGKLGTGLKSEGNAVTFINYRLKYVVKNIETCFCYIDNSNFCMTTPRDGVSLLICMPSWQEFRCMLKKQ